MPRLMVGLPSLTGKLKSYAERFDMVELQPVDSPLPSPAKLSRWRSEVPPGFAFSVVLPRAVGLLRPGAERDRALAESLEAARALAASCIVLATSSAVRPTRRNREHILELAERLPHEGVVRAWHAAGMWESDDVMQTAYQAGLLPIFDAAQEPLPPGPIAYTRIRALGQAVRMGSERIARIAEQLAERREAYVVADPPLAAKLKTGLAQALGQGRGRARLPGLFRPQGPQLFDDEEQ